MLGRAAAEPTVSRTVDWLASAGEPALSAVADAVAAVEAVAWVRRSLPIVKAVPADFSVIALTVRSEEQAAISDNAAGSGFYLSFAFMNHDSATGLEGSLRGRIERREADLARLIGR